MSPQMQVLQTGETALMLAAQGGHTKTIKVLLENGASIESMDQVQVQQSS